jgi:hypothetical protein
MEYVLARVMLADISTRDDARRCISSMIEGASRFGNMRGTVLMALVMLVEERDIALFADVLRRGDEWRDVVLSAISQLSPKHVVTLIDVLVSLTESDDVNERREALRILATGAGPLGLRTMVKLIATNPTIRRDATAVLRDRSDADVIRELMLTAEAGSVDAIAPVLCDMVPSRRTVEKLAHWVRSGRPEIAALGLRVLARAPPGEYKRVLDIARSVQESSAREVREQAHLCLTIVSQRAIESERIRRRQISRARRKQRRNARPLVAKS